jgi:CspA family cold shock protein
VYCRDCYQDKKGARGAGGPRGAMRHGPGAEARRPNPVAGRAPSSDSGRPTGSVKWFNEAKGFGFIVEDGGDEIFVHSSALQGAGLRSLSEGDRVEFDIMPGAKGKQAANVAKLD